MGIIKCPHTHLYPARLNRVKAGPAEDHNWSLAQAGVPAVVAAMDGEETPDLKTLLNGTGFA